MSDTVIFRPDASEQEIVAGVEQTQPQIQPQMSELQNGLYEASALVDDLVLKKYLHHLNTLEIVSLPDELKNIEDIRLFKITEMVYQKDEYSTYKFASVFASLQNLDCGIFVLVDSDGKKTDFYMGVRSLDNQRTTKSLKDTLKNALCGQFPGVKTQDFLDSEAEKILERIPSRNIVSVSCVAQNKDSEIKDNDAFIQGLEKFALAMQGQKYSLIVLAKSTPEMQLEETRKSYETIYTQLSPFASMQLSYSKNKALSISEAFSKGITTGTTYQKSSSTQKGSSHQTGTNQSEGESKPDLGTNLLKTAGSLALGAASILTAPLTGGASIAAAAAVGIGQTALNAIQPKTKSKSRGSSVSDSVSESSTEGESWGTNKSEQNTKTNTTGTTEGRTDTLQLTMQNKTLQDIMKKIDEQLKRMDECESIGMWECAAYVLSDSQETAEMAAGTYKALMKGEQSGVETSAVNFWGRNDTEKTRLLRDYITNFIHPVFRYPENNFSEPVLVSAASLISSNELAIQMGLPRKSVCGFPVIEHADFGKEVVTYSHNNKNRSFLLGKVFSMGAETDMPVRMDCDSLTMHTFVTGSTGSGKSNTVYEILDQLRTLYGIPFLVVEPAKGEYKNVFGQFEDVTVYGTNPKLADLLKINPFSFPEGIHVLEHLERLVEIFNVCWPMYAAMPAILKDAIEKAYIISGWDMDISENPKGNIFPNFADVLEQIREVITDSEYSADSKSDYSGALLTRVRSLTVGLNGKIFCADELKNEELFDRSAIIDLSRVGSSETKALIMGLLVMKLNEYRMVSGKVNSPLSHITVLEEAHNLLKKTSTEQSAESSNVAGKSVEMLANSIAEMRTYGEGFIIADQAPGLLDMSAIRNTNTKIILRLPEKSDRELVGYAAGLNEEQVDELAKLRRGVAAVYQNDWVEPVLVQVGKCDIEEKRYNYNAHTLKSDIGALKTQMFNFLIQGRVNEKLEFDVEKIERNLPELGLSVRNTEFIEEEIAEYKEKGTLELWDDSNFRRLSNRLTDILGVRNRVENCVLSAQNNAELSDMLRRIVNQNLSNLTAESVRAITQCLMRDMQSQQDNREMRNKIYMYWVEDEIKRGENL